MRVTRASAAKTCANEKARDILATEAASTFSLKEKGVFTNVSRAMVRDLVANLDIPLRSINATINVVAEALGVEVEGDVSQRSIRRMVIEGGIAAETQLVDEITCARGVTLSGDGTTHKNINYQSHHVTLTLPDGQTATRLAGILHEVNHTTNEMYSTYNDVMGGHNAADIRDFAPKVKGMLTDHAEDQKKLVRLFAEWKRECEREVRGEKALACLPPADVVRLLSEMMENVIETAGGYQQWDLLSLDERQLHSSKAIRQLRMTFGEKEFASLSSAEKEAVDFFVWAGCCMHKELNAAKGGNTRMRAWWEQNGVDGPVLLMNKDNAAAASAGSSVAKDRAVQVSTGGGQKTLDLAGSVFRHKDDKKGQHNSLRYYLETELGFTSQWPNTSNTRYHSHGDAACEYLVHKSWYMQFLEIVLFKKESRTHTNMEQNVFRGFSCLRTEEEITCWASYNQCLTHPYLRTIRNSSTNILDLGPIHAKVIAHLQCLIADVDLVLGPSASHETATLDGRPFERPEAIYAIQRIAQDQKNYPHLRRLLVTFLEGALDTWVRFCGEFTAGGVIDKSSAAQREMAYMKTTNNDNEGALGTVRTSLRRAPHMSLSHLNSRFMYKKNMTGTYIQKFLRPGAQKRLLKKARAVDTRGDERKRRVAQANYDKERVRKNKQLDVRRKEQREAAEAKLTAVVPRLTLAEVEKLRVDEINLQIRWYRQFDKDVPAAKNTPSGKAKKVEVLMDAVGRYVRGETHPKHDTQHSMEQPDGSNNAQGMPGCEDEYDDE
ncbi:hypothetical protein CY34DRAFT_26709 [Suillus luteus UH-Slu-Lm8-n1]|uniref:Uncharacterized protein n=1 Tax=Suillus luteus UH-Slu-Lm8-n1 TaxID=930992 RepID=A0A0D0AAF6_9AGAM|nr:hypothetical protein CY34DRAFT_26709 [Suillus luteus UH-Slu-Lm8-n1]